ncbi:MAG: response regulator [Bdellovibrionales bacterium]
MKWAAFIFEIPQKTRGCRFFVPLISAAFVVFANVGALWFFRDYVPMSFFLSAIVVSAWLAGRRFGFIATVLGGLVEMTLLSAEGAFFTNPELELTRLGVYLFQGFLISWLFGEFHRAQARVFESDEKLALALANERETHLETLRAQQTLAASQAQLEKERQSAEKASRVKSLFLANMSHEIRTPLTAIMGFVDLLKDPDLTESERQHYLQIIERTGSSLTTIINDILDISKVEAGHLEVEMVPFSPLALMKDLFPLLNLKAAEKSLEFRFEQHGSLPATVITDPLRLRQILMNLIGNAIKFTSSGFVEVVYGAQGDQLYFSVIDSGQGISREQIPKLFKHFSQGDSSISRKYAGTGLGLSLSRHLAKLLGGTIELIESWPGVGSTFRLTFRFQELTSSFETLASESQARVQVESSSLGQGLRVLVVDDSMDNQLLLEKLLEKQGNHVVRASNGVEALEKYDQQSFDLILMDMQMPVMDGFTAVRLLIARGCQAPIIALTAFAMKEDRENCLKAGCRDYLTKPLQKVELMNILRRYGGVSQEKSTELPKTV